MKITDLKCAVIGQNPVVRIVTDQGISGYGAAESYKPYLKPFILQFREALIGEDPTDVERCMMKIRNRGAFKPYGAPVSVIEHALWDVAGKAAGVPVYKLLGGKVRDKVRTYNGSLRQKLSSWTPEGFAESCRWMLALPEGFDIIKQGIGFHSPMKSQPGFFYGEAVANPFHGHADSGLIREPSMGLMIDCVAAMKEVLGDKVGLALDCGPGWLPTDALRFARAIEKYNVMWCEDMLTGDYSTHQNAQLYRDLTMQTTTPIHTGEQVYLRNNFKDLIETQAVNIVGPDPADVGGIAELKWIAEYAHIHGILMAPHGTGNGVLGLAALIQVCATLPANFIAFEYPSGTDPWWYDIVEGLPKQIVKNSMVDVIDRPGMGVDLIPEAAQRYLSAEDADFFR
ncbi:MAG: mandelate racemase/muconate lactonizing enzyme family protein [bacterium]